jgi:hypothetical protein
VAANAAYPVDMASQEPEQDDTGISEAARRGLARIESAIAQLPPDEIEAIRAVASTGEDEVEGFVFSVGSGSSVMGGGGIDSDLWSVMTSYQKMLNKEAREDRKIARS